MSDQVSVGVISEEDSATRIYHVGIRKAGKAEVQEGQAREDVEYSWGGTSYIPPPVPVEGAILWYGRSKILRPYVQAMAQGVTGSGYAFRPVIDLYDEEAAESVAIAMYLHRREKWQQEKEQEKEDEGPELPTKEEVEITLKEWRREAKLEKALLEHSFKSFCYENSWSELNRQREINENVLGWACWEVIRSEKTGRIQRLKHVEPWTCRLTQLGDPVEVSESVPISPVHYTTVKVQRKFRKIIQQGMHFVYFKEFGDPRIMSSKTGRCYESEKELQRSEGEGALAANEIMWFSDYHPGTPYGLMPWHGITPVVRGSRLADDNVVDDLLNNSIPRVIITASDMRLGKNLSDEIRAFFAANQGEVRNRAMVIEAMTERSGVDATGNVHAKIDVIPLSNQQEKDASFLEYQLRAFVNAGAQFGIPPILVGLSSDYNRATSAEARRSVEENVFEPRRERFSSYINRTILRNMGIRFWVYEQCSPTQTDLEKVSRLLLGALEHGAIVPSEARPLLERLLNIDLPSEAGDWQRQPMKFTLAGIQPPSDTTAEEATEGQDEDEDDIDKRIAAIVGAYAGAEAADDLAKELEIRGRTEGDRILAEVMGGED